MKLLVIGGTRFLGRHVVQQALDAGHAVTLLHRGKSGPDLFPQAEHRLGDRDGDLSVLAQGEWDAVIDTSAYFPRQVRALAAALQGRVGHYQLVSSISAYASSEHAGLDESGPLATLADPTVETITGETYGGLKVLCERAAQEAFGAPCLINRPGLLVGPHDPTGRFTWWVQRAVRGGELLAPGEPQGPAQFIDARDAAAWMLRQSEARTQGVFNLTGPDAPLTMGTFLQTAVDTLAPAGSTLRWIDESFLLGRDVAPWSELPVWLPSASAGLHQVNIDRALATDLHCRPLADTLRDTAAWATAAALPPQPGIGMTPEREAELLAAWSAR